MRRALLALTLAGAVATGQAGFLDPLWTLLSSVWSESSPNEGCILDPDGWCDPAPQTDAGCILDPEGQCRPQGS